MNDNKLVSLIMLDEQRGQYAGPRRGIDIKLNPGKRKNEIIELALKNLQKRYSDYEGIFIDRKRTIKTFDEIFQRTYPTFMSIYMWPSTNEKAVLTMRTPSLAVGTISLPGSQRSVSYDPEEVRFSGELRLSSDLSIVILSDAFFKILLNDLEGFGLTSHIVKTLKVNISLPKTMRSVGEEEEVGYDEEQDVVVVKGEPYATGNARLNFVEEINGKELRDYLALKGYDVGQELEEDEEESEEINEQASSIYKTDEDDTEEHIDKKEAPIIKMKKTMVVDSVNKLIKNIDEFVKTIQKEDPSAELSDFLSIFTDLIDKLNKLGLVGK